MPLEVVLFCAMLLAVLAGCLVPNAWLPPLPNDKLMHFAAFGGLTLLAARCVPPGPLFGLAVFGLFALGWLIEWLQDLLPDRSFSWRDLIANGAGIGAALLLLALLPRLGDTQQFFVK